MFIYLIQRSTVNYCAKAIDTSKHKFVTLQSLKGGKKIIKHKPESIKQKNRKRQVVKKSNSKVNSDLSIITSECIEFERI